MEFSDIALAKLLQTAPDLGSLIINFQDVSEELGEDVGCRVGIFILRSGAEILYVPVVGRGEDVYPIDSVFVDSEKKFMPLTRKVIDSVVASGQMEPGKVQKMPDSVTVNPSVYNLINPPRTGKHVYASASRLLDFLAVLPNHVKQATFDKIAGERSLYEDLDKMFSIKAVFDVLKPTPASAAAVVNQVPISVVTTPTQGMGQEAISNILNDGYHISGTQPTRRVAVAVQSAARSKVYEVSPADYDRDFDLVFQTGQTREAFIPKMHLYGGSKVLAIFTNGDYAVSTSMIAVGEQLDRKKVLDRLFDFNPPVLLRDVSTGDNIALMTVDGEFLGPYRANKVVLTGSGVELSVSGGSIDRIVGTRHFAGKAELEGSTLYVRSNTVVIKLAENVTFDLAVNVNSASKRLEVNDLQLLGSELNLGFDGVEFIANGKAVGSVPRIMELLVVKEGIEPTLAKSFVKQAQETKFVKIFLSKQASSTDYNPAEIPSYGLPAPKQGDLGMNGSFLPSVNQANQLGDSQVVEATIISELLQVPDLMEQIGEYLPDIEEAVDKLGRILFMSRVHINRLGESLDSDSVFSLLAQIKSVYRLLGDNLLKLKRLSTTAQMAPGVEE